jgi:hypothetical protein
MILLYDSKIRRAQAALRAYSTGILHWSSGAWRNLEDNECELAANEIRWLLVHDSDMITNTFNELLLREKALLAAIPRVRFTGGSPAGKPEGEFWVRYRLISEDQPFTAEELGALDQWALDGCCQDKRPWLLLEEKPHHIRGLLILLQIAEKVGPHRLIGEGDRGRFRVESPTWWKERLDREGNWETKLMGELSRRTSNPDVSKALASFIDWVQGKICTGEPCGLFDHVSNENPKTRLSSLITLLWKCV